MHNKIVFNKPILIGNEENIFKEFLKNNRFSHGGIYQTQVELIFEEMFGTKTLLTKSCTAALEMCALLLDLKNDDEVIIPAYTFSSTANAFLLRGCKVRFADSMIDHPNICIESVKKLINKKTKALVIVHYAGTPCDMDAIVELCHKQNIVLIEDAAQAINTKCQGKYLGTFGDLGAMSFHDTKNISCGEGGLLIINNMSLLKKAQDVLTHGNDKLSVKDHSSGYNWVDIGSSYGLSELHSCFLLNNLLNLEKIQKKRESIYNLYRNNLKGHDYNNSQNSHVFFLLMENEKAENFIKHMNNNGIQVFRHFKSLSESIFNVSKDFCPNAIKFQKILVRLPIYYNLTKKEVKKIIYHVNGFYE